MNEQTALSVRSYKNNLIVVVESSQKDCRQELTVEMFLKKLFQERFLMLLTSYKKGSQQLQRTNFKEKLSTRNFNNS